MTNKYDAMLMLCRISDAGGFTFKIAEGREYVYAPLTGEAWVWESDHGPHGRDLTITQVEAGACQALYFRKLELNDVANHLHWMYVISSDADSTYPRPLGDAIFPTRCAG